MNQLFFSGAVLVVSENWKLVLGILFGIVLGAMLVHSCFADGEKVRKSLQFKDFTVTENLILMLFAGLIIRFIGVKTGMMPEYPPGENQYLWSCITGGVIAGFGLLLAGFAPVSAIAGLGTGNLTALWALCGMAVAIPVMKKYGHNLSDLISRWDAKLGCGKVTADFFDTANPALFAVIFTGVILLAFLLAARKK